MQEGAEAVIASPLPVFDRAGRAFGTMLYKSEFASTSSMAAAFAQVRSVIELMMRKSPEPSLQRAWPTWSLLRYLGNPYMQLPHLAAQPRLHSAFFDWLASCFGARGAEEVKTSWEQTRGRFG